MMLRTVSLASGILLCTACDPAKGGGEVDGSPLREKLDAYLREGAISDSAQCFCELGSKEECQYDDGTSKERRNCYLEGAGGESEKLEAFLVCATAAMKRYTACTMKPGSCDAGADECDAISAEMLACPLPSRAVRAAWDVCDEET